MRCLENFAARGRQRSEEKDPQLAADIRAIVEPHTYADPELKSSRRYTNLSAAEVREALIAKGHSEAELPSERTLRDILNRMNYRLKRIQKGKPLKKTKETDAIFANVKEVQGAGPGRSRDAGDLDGHEGEGGPGRLRSWGEKPGPTLSGKVTKGWDHDPPAKEKLVPFGILMRRDRGVDAAVRIARDQRRLGRCACRCGGSRSGAGIGHVKRLVIYLDNGPKNSGRRTQFLKRMVQFADWSGLEIRLVYYPPYHSKYNPIERCWSALEKKWNGVLLNCLKVVLQCALRMTWKGRHPTVKRLHGEYARRRSRRRQGDEAYEARLQRSATLPKYDITIKPRSTEPQVK